MAITAEEVVKAFDGVAAAKVWTKGGKTRVYLTFPRGSGGAGGGGEIGHIEVAPKFSVAISWSSVPDGFRERWAVLKTRALELGLLSA